MATQRKTVAAPSLARSGRWGTWRGVIREVDVFNEVVSFADESSRRLITLSVLKGADFRVHENSVEAICHEDARLLFEEALIC